MTDHLVAFLRARLDEDLEAVRLVLGVNVMAAIRHGESAPRWVPSPKGDAGVWDTDGVPRVKFVWARERDHIIRHDPARVLAEAEAKRLGVQLHSAEPGQHPDFCGYDKHLLPCPALRLLALPYADHPDYRELWRP